MWPFPCYRPLARGLPARAMAGRRSGLRRCPYSVLRPGRIDGAKAASLRRGAAEISHRRRESAGMACELTIGGSTAFCPTPAAVRGGSGFFPCLGRGRYWRFVLFATAPGRSHPFPRPGVGHGFFMPPQATQ
jgi:hypothetical protein